MDNLPNFEGWNPHRIEDRNPKFYNYSLEEAIFYVLSDFSGLTTAQIIENSALTSWQICEKLSANSLLIPTILSGVEKCLDEHNSQYSNLDWYCRKFGDKWSLYIKRSNR